MTKPFVPGFPKNSGIPSTDSRKYNGLSGKLSSASSFQDFYRSNSEQFHNYPPPQTSMALRSATILPEASAGYAPYPSAYSMGSPLSSGFPVNSSPPLDSSLDSLRLDLEESYRANEILLHKEAQDHREFGNSTTNTERSAEMQARQQRELQHREAAEDRGERPAEGAQDAAPASQESQARTESGSDHSQMAEQQASREQAQPDSLGDVVGHTLERKSSSDGQKQTADGLKPSHLRGEQASLQEAPGSRHGAGQDREVQPSEQVPGELDKKNSYARRGLAGHSLKVHNDKIQVVDQRTVQASKTTETPAGRILAEAQLDSQASPTQVPSPQAGVIKAAVLTNQQVAGDLGAVQELARKNNGKLNRSDGQDPAQSENRGEDPTLQKGNSSKSMNKGANDFLASSARSPLASASSDAAGPKTPGQSMQYAPHGKQGTDPAKEVAQWQQSKVSHSEGGGYAGEQRASSPAPSASIPAPLRSFAQQMAQRLQEGPLAQNLRQLQFRLFDQNRGEIRLRLQPEHLGQIRIQLSIDGSQLSGRIVADTAQAARIVQDNLEHLEASLHEGGFENQGLDVSVGGGQAEKREHAEPQLWHPAKDSKDPLATWEDLGGRPVLEQSQIDYRA